MRHWIIHGSQFQFSASKKYHKGEAIINPMEPKKFISDLIDLGDAKPKHFNLIASGCGTGKSFLVYQHLRDYYNDVRPEDIIVVTSRSLTVDQQAKQYNGVEKFTVDKRELINHWNGDERGAGEIDEGVYDMNIMPYNKFVYLLDYCANEEHESLCNAKIIVFDECHTLLSDTFVENIAMIRVWLYMTLYHTDKLIFGLTATPGILFENKKRLGVRINQMNDEVHIRYKAKKLTCADIESVPALVNGFKGKTLIMCNSYEKCKQMAKQIPYSFVMVSPNNDHFTKEMSWVRNVIAETSKFPDYRMVPRYRDLDKDDPLYEEFKDETMAEPFKVLIATSTIREGFDLIPDSGVRNIVCCIPDDLHVIQVAGRARYDLDNLVVAAPLRGKVPDYKIDPYLIKQREEFKDYLRGNNCGSEWFQRIACIVESGMYEPERKVKVADVMSFKRWFDSEWLTIGDEEKLLFKKEDRDELAAKCLEYRVVDLPPSKMSFQKALKALERLGYVITEGQMKVDGRRFTYKVFRRNERCA